MKRIKLLIGIILTLTIASPVYAASVFLFIPDNIKTIKNETFDLSISIDSDTIKSYTTSLSLEYPANLLEIKNFSFANNWISLPDPKYNLIDNTNGLLIKTAGFTSGFSGTKNFGTITFLAKNQGAGAVKIKDDSFALNINNQDVFNDELTQVSVIISTGEADGTRADQISAIISEAKIICDDSAQLLTEKFNLIRDLGKEVEIVDQYVKPLTAELLQTVGFEKKQQYSLANFIAYGTPTTLRLGDGERAGVVNSYKDAFSKLPTSDEEWSDVIKIANGRWPNERNEEREQRGNDNFRVIYLREPDRSNPNDDAAVVIIAYGLRPTQRNLNSEAAAIQTFANIYGYGPHNAITWDIVRAIAYSGATRQVESVKSKVESQEIETALFTSDLQLESYGEEVRLLQEKLRELGFFPKEQRAGGYYGQLTQESVRKFQIANGIENTGNVGSLTRAELNK